MSHSAWLALVLLVACGQPETRSDDAPAHPAGPYVGLEHPPEPAGVEDQGGWVILTDAWRDNRDTTVHAVQRVRIAGRLWVWLDTLARHTPDGKAIWRVVAELQLPETPPNSGLVSTCHGVPGAVEGQVFALVEWADADQEYHRVIHHAWRVDLDALAIAEIPAAGVRCTNDAYGL